MMIRNTFRNKNLKINRVSGNLKVNIARIGQKIEDGDKEGRDLNKGIYKVTDMIRTTVICNTVD